MSPDPGAADQLEVGDELVVDVGPVAHGGHCVARRAGRVFFVRHALPGEQVRVRVTGLGRRGRFLRADAVQVLRASPDRRPEPCPVAALCGGCDWQHATPEASRALKAQVVTEALARFAGITWDPAPQVLVVAAQGDTDHRGAAATHEGLGWRTRGTLSVDSSGGVGFRAPRSHAVVPTDACLQLDPRLAGLGLFTTSWATPRVGFVVPADGPPLAYEVGAAPEDPVTERAAGRTWEVAADGFWQVHPGAADALVEHVRRMLGPRPGERLVDLYAGVGLFGVSLAGATSDLRVTLVEGDRRACALAEVNAGTLPVTVVKASVDRWIAGAGAALVGVDLVVLDPPRTGAGAAVVSTPSQRPAHEPSSTSPATRWPWPGTSQPSPRRGCGWPSWRCWTCSPRRITSNAWRCSPRTDILMSR